MKNPRTHLRILAALVLFAAVLSATTTASAQFIFNVDTGYQETTYGSNTTIGKSKNVGAAGLSYSQGPNDTAIANLGLGFVFAGHSHSKYGFNVYALGDISLPFKTDANTGGVIAGGGVVGMNLRIRQVAVGTGIDLHDYVFPSDGSTVPKGDLYPSRPNELLMTIPVVGKYSFGPAGRAYVQGGVGFIVANIPGTYSDGYSNDQTTLLGTDLSLSNSKQSFEYKISGGYSFGHLTARMGYIRRDVYFDPTNSSVITTNVPSSYFDFHQDITTVGIVLTAF